VANEETGDGGGVDGDGGGVGVGGGEKALHPFLALLAGLTNTYSSGDADAAAEQLALFNCMTHKGNRNKLLESLYLCPRRRMELLPLCRWCDCSCDVHVCSFLLSYSLGSESALVTFVCVLCTLRTRISRSVCNSVFTVII
jgi:hypothetical protein